MCLIFGFCCGAGGLVNAGIPLILDMVQQVVSKKEPEIRKKFAEEKRKLEARRAATTNPNVARQLDEQIANLDNLMKMDMSAIFEAMFPDSVRTCFIFEGITAVGLYLMMFIAGCGMFGLAPWSRMLAMVSAAGRIVTALIFAVLNVVVIMPAMAESAEKFKAIFEQMSQGGQTRGMPGQGYDWVISVILACAWSIALLVMVNSKDAKEAFGVGDDGGGSGLDVQGGDGKRITLVPK
jgi:hypothetical protein